jgi:hypothetical protein
VTPVVCFVGTVGQPLSRQALWFVVLLAIAVAVKAGVRHQATGTKVRTKYKRSGTVDLYEHDV